MALISLITAASNAPQVANAPANNQLALKDIHLPEQISAFPFAYGWWLLLCLCLVFIVLTVIQLQKRKKLNQVKKQAIKLLTPDMSSADMIALLKWAAMHYLGRARLARLHGESLQTYLAAQLPTKHQATFTRLSQAAFSNQYQKSSVENTTESCFQAATLWLNYALPVKQEKGGNHD